MFRVLYKCIVILLCVLLSTTVSAEADKTALGEELLEVTQSKQLIDNMFPQVEMMLKNSLKGLNVEEKDKPIIERYNQKVMALMKREMDWNTLKPQFIAIYTRTFSVSELQELLAFYRSPTGKKVIKKMPLLMQESMQMVQGQVKQLLPQMQQLTNEMKREINAN